MDERLAVVVAHVDQCATCSAANKRVNDFCEEGRLLFLEYAKHQAPNSVEEVELSDEQYYRLIAETRRRRRNAERN